MTVSDLMEFLRQCPPDARVGMTYAKNTPNETDSPVRSIEEWHHGPDCLGPLGYIREVWLTDEFTDITPPQ